jgi:hypothetical protein
MHNSKISQLWDPMVGLLAPIKASREVKWLRQADAGQGDENCLRFAASCLCAHSRLLAA